MPALIGLGWDAFSRHRQYVALAVIAALVLWLVPFGRPVADAATTDNIVVILTDDQRWDTLWSMPFVQSQLVNKGVTFNNAYATTPQCCPFRGSFMSGGFWPHNTKVLSNNSPNGGHSTFHDAITLGNEVRRAGLVTGFFGKYMNGYEADAPYVPKGWNEFVAWIGSGWQNYNVVQGTSALDQSSQGTIVPISRYITDYLRDEAIAFIDANKANRFFMVISTTAPHGPATPAPGDENLFDTFVPNRPNMNETDLTDKPQWLQNYAGYEDETEFARDQLRSLQAVDRMFDAVRARLQTHKLMSKTTFIFVSDNGMMWGEHGVHNKAKPYEESIRVPLVIRSKSLGTVNNPRAENRMVAANLDLGQTILSMVGSTIDSDGEDLTSIIQNNPPPTWRWNDDGMLLQYFDETSSGNDRPPLWAGWLTPTHKYVVYPQTGEEELYDLVADPYELESKHADPNYATVKAQLAAKVDANAGVVLTEEDAPSAQVGIPYSFTPAVRWGNAPYDAKLETGTLPPGLSLNTVTREISGTPTTSGNWTHTYKVKDSTTSPQNGFKQNFFDDYTITVNP